MNKILKLNVKLFGKIISYFLPHGLSSSIEKLADLLYTGQKMRFFSSFGAESIVCYKASCLSGMKYVSVGKHTRLGKNIQITAIDSFKELSFLPNITIGDYCCIRENSHITAINNITIGNKVLTGTNVLITDNSHGNSSLEHMNMRPELRPLESKGSVTICDNVWLGNNVCVMPGVTIGEGTIVGANSVVTKSLPSHCVAVGVPAKIIKQL